MTTVSHLLSGKNHTFQIKVHDFWPFCVKKNYKKKNYFILNGGREPS